MRHAYTHAHIPVSITGHNRCGLPPRRAVLASALLQREQVVQVVVQAVAQARKHGRASGNDDVARQLAADGVVA